MSRDRSPSRSSELPAVCSARLVRAELQTRVDPKKKAFYPSFFKTGVGEYGEGDRFFGVTVPKCREVARLAANINERGLVALLKSPIHEQRLVALLILVNGFHRGDEPRRQQIYRTYLDHMDRVNNWDLVDLSAHVIVGGFWQGREPEAMRLWLRWTRSGHLWTRRIAMMSCFHSIKRGEFEPGLRVAEALVSDSHDLIHKAVGWMLREIGKRDLPTEEVFLDRHYRTMPRTMLRYAIEKFPEARRRHYLARE